MFHSGGHVELVASWRRRVRAGLEAVRSEPRKRSGRELSCAELVGGVGRWSSLSTSGRRGLELIVETQLSRQTR